MRIIAGEFRSRPLTAPRGMNTRPTSDRLRETLFNVLAPRIHGARFLDLYAGSGANGLEALSRGVVEAVFVEQARPALAAIRANVAALGLSERARVEAMTVSRWLDGAARSGSCGMFDVIFLDPPYADAAEYAGTLTRLGDTTDELLAEGGVVVVEHRRTSKQNLGAVPGWVPGWEDKKSWGGLVKRRVLTQGDAGLSFFSRDV